jgi:hypothetical protein
LLPGAFEFSASGQNKKTFSMAHAVFEIADKLLTGGGHQGSMPIDAIALDTIICINTQWGDGNQYRNNNEK